MSGTQLTGEIEAIDGRAPESAWQAVEETLRRPEDIWLEGDPASALESPESWHGRIRHRLEQPEGKVGLRLRVVPGPGSSSSQRLLDIVRAMLPALPLNEEALFFHAEIMRGPEPGLYLAYVNRLPALMTQVLLLGGGASDGEFEQMGSGNLHLNLLLHDPHKGLAQALTDDTVEDCLRRAGALTGAPIPVERLHGLTMAGSDAHACGISVGLENLRQESGARGGSPA